MRVDMLSVESVPVVVHEEEERQQQQLEQSEESTLVAKGCFPLSMSPPRTKNLRRFAQKFIVDGEKKHQHCVFELSKSL